jgi:methanogenic corrinoid protein MtbC1
MSTLAEPPHIAYFGRLLGLDRAGALELVEEFLRERGGDVEALYKEVLMPAMVHAGVEWEADRISVAHEHYISEVTRDLIHRHGPKLWQSVTPQDQAPVAVTCAAPEERHVLGLMMVGDILRAAGVIVHSLGEGAPPRSVADFASQLRADLLAISVGLAEHLPLAAELVSMVKEARPDLVVLAGGHAFSGRPGSAEAIGADYSAPGVDSLRALLPDLLSRLRPAVA